MQSNGSGYLSGIVSTRLAVAYYLSKDSRYDPMRHFHRIDNIDGLAVLVQRGLDSHRV